MKTAVKISLAAAGILAVLGIAGLGVGMALGGGPSVFRGLSRLPGILRFTHGTPGSSIVSSEPYGEEMQDYQNVKNLTLDFSACELQIRTHEESFISLSASNTQDTFSCEQYGEDLILEDHREIFGDDAAAYPDQALRLTLLVPRETLDTQSRFIAAWDLWKQTLCPQEIWISILIWATWIWTGSRFPGARLSMLPAGM